MNPLYIGDNPYSIKASFIIAENKNIAGDKLNLEEIDFITQEDRKVCLCIYTFIYR